MKKNPLYFLLFCLLTGSAFLSGCNDDEVPPAENEEELITDVRLKFVPVNSGTPVTVTASDPDGEGPEGLQTDEPIVLAPDTEYTLNIELENSLAGEDMTVEIEEEADEHLFFFSWTDGLFTAPAGNGNTDQRTDPVLYGDKDQNELPLGLLTLWTTGDAGEGTFRVILKHQPNLKSATSTAQQGTTDVDITWNVSIE